MFWFLVAVVGRLGVDGSERNCMGFDSSLLVAVEVQLQCLYYFGSVVVVGCCIDCNCVMVPFVMQRNSDYGRLVVHPHP